MKNCWLLPRGPRQRRMRSAQSQRSQLGWCLVDGLTGWWFRLMENAWKMPQLSHNSSRCLDGERCQGFPTKATSNSWLPHELLFLKVSCPIIPLKKVSMFSCLPGDYAPSWHAWSPGFSPWNCCISGIFRWMSLEAMRWALGMVRNLSSLHCERFVSHCLCWIACHFYSILNVKLLVPIHKLKRDRDHREPSGSQTEHFLMETHHLNTWFLLTGTQIQGWHSTVVDQALPRCQSATPPKSQHLSRLLFDWGVATVLKVWGINKGVCLHARLRQWPGDFHIETEDVQWITSFVL